LRVTALRVTALRVTALRVTAHRFGLQIKRACRGECAAFLSAHVVPATGYLTRKP
jgi:hypothetical protein